nr:hypothetical protein L204_01352 [Cryptococcus depauperatus CBS 7855]
MPLPPLRPQKTRLVSHDSVFVAFYDRAPQAKSHILLIPQNHIVSSVRDLTPQHLPLTYTLVPSDPPPKLGFHIPPFYSVPHLHLHVFSGPHTFLGRFKYPTSSRKGGKGYGWFVTAKQVQQILEKGSAIGLGPS